MERNTLSLKRATDFISFLKTRGGLSAFNNVKLEDRWQTLRFFCSFSVFLCSQEAFFLACPARSVANNNTPMTLALDGDAAGRPVLDVRTGGSV